MTRTDLLIRQSRITMAVFAALVCLAAPAAAHHEGPEPAAPSAVLDAQPIQLASAGVGLAAQPRVAAQLDLEDPKGYNSSYMFGMTRGVAQSTLSGAFKPMVMVLTVPLDIAFLPFAAIGGFFG